MRKLYCIYCYPKLRYIIIIIMIIIMIIYY